MLVTFSLIWCSMFVGFVFGSFALLLFFISIFFFFFFFFFFQAEDGIRDLTVTEFRRVLFRSAFDLLYWNADSTNLPGPMYCYYLRNTYLENKLRIPNALKNCGVPVDLGKVKLPMFGLAKIGRASCRERV